MLLVQDEQLISISDLVLQTLYLCLKLVDLVVFFSILAVFSGKLILLCQGLKLFDLDYSLTQLRLEVFGLIFLIRKLLRKCLPQKLDLLCHFIYSQRINV